MTSPRVVSLIPSATEWICKLGYAEQLVGVSHECDFPAPVKDLPKVTRSVIPLERSSREIDQQVRQHAENRIALYDVDVDLLNRLRPDVIVTQSLCRVCAVDRSLVQRATTAWDCRILDLRGTDLQEILTDGEMVADGIGNTSTSDRTLRELRSRMENIRATASVPGKRRPTVTLLEWTDPIFCSGHWTPRLIQWAGGDDPIGAPGEPSRTIGLDQLCDADPEMLLVACCGFNLQQTQAQWQLLRREPSVQKLTAVQTGNVHCFDGSAWFNRAGPRLVDAMQEVARLINEWKPTLRSEMDRFS